MAIQTTVPTRTPEGTGVADSGLLISRLSKNLGGRTIVDAFDLSIRHGELLALLGPSGCGKTTTLRMIAGFLEPDTGSVLIDGRDVTTLGPEKRPSAMVFQNYALWPYLSVFKNVAFPLTLKRLPRAEVRDRVMAALETVNLAHHKDSRPAHISGGEQQRAALARAIVQEPELLLLDEPLSNLDAKLRVRVREEIREIQQRLAITTVMVTHDQEEALAISDRVAVMNEGRIEQVSTPSELYANPQTRFVASFIGSMNFLTGADLGAARVAGAPDPDAAESADVWAVRPEDVTFASTGGGPAEVRRVLPHGHFAELVVDIDGLSIRSIVTGAVPAVGERGSLELRNVRHYRNGLLEGAVA
ncbi:MAG: polyamine transporter ATPase [Frondihabitans sp.]|nr:polyamine transporter ATPase [Frondihabitans sp.]